MRGDVIKLIMKTLEINYPDGISEDDLASIIVSIVFNCQDEDMERTGAFLSRTLEVLDGGKYNLVRR